VSKYPNEDPRNDPSNKLMQRVQSGDTAAFEILVKQNINSSYYFVERMLQNKALSEDIVQEGFLKVWESREKWRAEANFKTWLFKMLYNLCIDQIRKQQKSTILKQTFANNLVNKTNSEQSARTERNQELLDALATLKPEEKAILFWFYYHAMPQQNIAEMMDMTISAVESALYRVRQKLKENLK
tara:strand:+ start:10267 stop:10821 length:555 start_codon:yes stop_codon:yes gene_type:complete